MPIPTRVAFLILAHAHPLHLSKLLTALEAKNARVFLHIDSKSDIDPNNFAHMPHVELAKKRTSIHWGDWGIVQATLDLMHQASFHRSFSHYALLSGVDYPLLPVAEIIQFFEENQNTIHLNTRAMPSPAKPLSRLIMRGRALPRTLEGMAQRIVRKFDALIWPKDISSVLNGRKPFSGSQWWVLPADASEYVLNVVKREPFLVRRFSYTECPDEMFFQTILANSEFLHQIQPSLTYADWSEGGPHPACITERHIHLLRGFAANRRYLFARKFTEESDDIIAEIKRFSF